MSAIYSNIDFPSAKVVLSTAASVAATLMVVRSLAKDLLPNELQHYVYTKFHYLLTSAFSNEITLVIDEFDGLNKNQLFSAAELYAAAISSPSSRTYRVSLPEKEKKIRVFLGQNEEIVDEFCKTIHLKWRFVAEKSQRRRDYPSAATSSEIRSFKLTFHKKHKSKVIDEYLPYVLERSKALKEEKKTLKLHTLRSEKVHGPGITPWQSANLNHPAKFETLAMDDEIKSMIVDDLDRFLKRKELYRKIGKAWKRGYLLYGPPGTGKSSLIAAMANYLNFDVYDLELTDIRSNSELRKLLISTANRSILVVEDIDASIDLSERKAKKAAEASQLTHMYRRYQSQEPKVTLSGLLNFVDGLWSSIGDERIIIFTTNHKEKLDPALLRPGRMDVHVHMSYCTPCGFRLLARNYLGITEHHPLVLKTGELIGSSKIMITPAEVGEQLLKSEDPELALQGLVMFLEGKCEEIEVVGEECKEGISKLKMSKSSDDGLREWKESASAEMNGRKDEASNAFGFLQQEIGNYSESKLDL
ncbi:AAA-ATPase At3g50940-like [Salvia miltiorrhiza]|uniref:AAA-ATPase At3g50940-like n=1 Tax=Salvia miltiorrhiza TaxID=226208 RepID=UPI0025ACAB64|nr:AAA-ATPase At3g50940-like [Salvia miltiorrhiza]